MFLVENVGAAPLFRVPNSVCYCYTTFSIFGPVGKVRTCLSPNYKFGADPYWRPRVLLPSIPSCQHNHFVVYVLYHKTFNLSIGFLKFF